MTSPPRDPTSDPSSESDDPASVQPGTITRIAEQRRARGRVWVEIDGRRGLSLAADVVAGAGLGVGDDLDEALMARLLTADDVARATQTALAFLAYRPRSEKEVRDRLRRGGFAPETADQVITRLYEWRYLDDADFARRWVESRASGRARGSRLLNQELWQKGVDRETAREAIEEAEIDEAAAAEKLARDRLRGYAGEDAVVIRRRLGAYLSRRGYSYDIVRGALERVLGNDEATAEEPVE